MKTFILATTVVAPAILVAGRLDHTLMIPGEMGHDDPNGVVLGSAPFVQPQPGRKTKAGS